MAKYTAKERVAHELEINAAQGLKNSTDFMYETHQSLQNLRFALDETKKSLNSLIAEQGSDRVSFGVSLSKTEDVIKANYLSVLKDLDQQRAKIEEYLLSYSSRYLEIKNSYLLKADFEADVPQIKRDLIKMQVENKEAEARMTSLVHKLSSDFELKLKAFKEEILARPSDTPTIKKYLEDKIDLVAMDGTNASVRSANCEKQLEIIEKKIEHIYLLLKKLDLNKQG